MTAEELNLIRSSVHRIEAQARDAMYSSYLRSLTKRTCTLWSSIRARIHIAPRAGQVSFILRITAGGGGAFYGAFLEYGTGIHATRSDLMRQPYFDGGKQVPFNADRLRFPAGTGYLILRRTGNRKGSFHSRGIPAKHWFSQGCRQAFNKFTAMTGELETRILRLPKIESWLYF